MAQWRIKELSDLTKISVRTLHHYDHIGLLKPSVRSDNGYRWYSQRDLEALQQILSLKFFGFDLNHIKTIMASKLNVLEHLLTQQQVLKEQMVRLLNTQEAIDTAITELTATGSLEWQYLIVLIERYNMTHDLKNSWAGKIYTEEQINQIAVVDKYYPEEEKQAFRALWAEVFAHAKANLDKDPASPIGKKLGLQYSMLKKTLEQAYGDYPELWKAMCKAYNQGKIPDEVYPKKEGDWLEQAAQAWKDLNKKSCV